MTFMVKAQSQWENLNYPYNVFASDLIVHKDELYALSSLSIFGAVYKYKNGEWEKMNTSQTQGYPLKMIDAGDTLYYQTTNGDIVSPVYNIYYSTDGGENFTLRYSRSKRDQETMYDYYHNTLYLTRYNEYCRLEGDSCIAFNNGKVKYSFVAKGMAFLDDSLYTIGPEKLFVSGDKGDSFIEYPINLSEGEDGFQFVSMLKIDPTTSTFYCTGQYKKDYHSDQYGLYVSNDRGRTWQLHNFSEALESNGEELTLARYISAYAASDNHIYLGFEKNKINTRPDFLSSATGVENIHYDTLGIDKPKVKYSGEGPAVTSILFYEGKVYAAMSDAKIYVKDLLGEPTRTKDREKNIAISLYPNPAKNVVNIIQPEHSGIKTMRILNPMGTVIIESKNASSSLDISQLTQGYYILNIELQDGSYLQENFIKQ